jgi:hypothetical protein
LEGTELSAMAASGGRFLLDRVPPGLHTLVARVGHKAIAVVVDVAAGKETAVGDLVLREAGQVSGLVTSAADGAPLPGVRVTVTEVVRSDTPETKPHPIRIAHTNASGSYTIFGLPIGPYLVTATRPGYQTASLAVDVKAGATTPGDIRLTPDEPGAQGSVSGTVSAVTADGGTEPLAGALVRLAAPDDPVAYRPLPGSAGRPGGGKVEFYDSLPPGPPVRELYTFSDEKGAYRVDGVPAGTYTAVAVRPGFVTDSKPVTVAAGQDAIVDFTLKVRTPATGAIEGIVTDAVANAPIAGAVVGVRWAMQEPGDPGAGGGVGTDPPSTFIWPGDVDMVVQTGADGSFRMRTPAGKVHYYVEANGFELFQESVAVQAGATTAVKPALTKLAGETAALTGIVTTSSATGATAPVAGAEVVAVSVDMTLLPDGPMPRPTRKYVTRSASDGTFRLDVVRGLYDVSAWKDGLWARPVQLTVQSDTTTTLVLEPAPIPMLTR